MKIYQCSNPSLSSSLPMVFPHCCPMECCSPGCLPAPVSPLNGIAPSSSGIFPLLASQGYPCELYAPSIPVAQPAPGPLPPELPAQARSLSADAAEPPEMSSSEPASADAPSERSSLIALPESAPSEPFPDEWMGCAVQYSLTTSGAHNADILTLEPQTVSGKEITPSSTGLLFAPDCLYLVSFSLKAHPGPGRFAEVIPQLDGGLSHDFSAFSSAADGESSPGDAGLSSSFLLNTTAREQPTHLELVFHTDAADRVPVRGSLLACKLGSIHLPL